MKSGLPFDVAMALNPADVVAYCIIFGELDGLQKWDWDAMTFRKVEI